MDTRYDSKPSRNRNAYGTFSRGPQKKEGTNQYGYLGHKVDRGLTYIELRRQQFEAARESIVDWVKTQKVITHKTVCVEFKLSRTQARYMMKSLFEEGVVVKLPRDRGRTLHYAPSNPIDNQATK